MEENHSKRRRFFRRAAFATLVGVLAAGIGYKAYAHGGWGAWHRGESIDPARMEEHLERMLKHLYAEVDATEEQKRRLAPIVKDAARDLMPLRGKAREAKQRAVELFSAPTLDQQAIESLRAEQLRLADEASRRLTRALTDVSEVLTPEQRKNLAQHFAQHRGRRHHGPAS